jgi:hypothetical protein
MPKGGLGSTNQTVVAPAIESPAALLSESSVSEDTVVEMQIAETMGARFFLDR